MTDRPTLTLGDRAVKRRPVFDRRTTFFSVCVLILFGMVVYLLLRPPSAAGPEHAVAASDLSVEEQHALARQLEDRNLPYAAAEVWRSYLARGRPDRAQAGALHYRIANLLKQAGKYQQAVASYYTAERMVDEGEADLRQKIALGVRECFQKLGQYGDLSRELAARSALKPAEGTLGGQQVVAQIGPRKMTVAEFDQRVQRQIDATVRNVPGISPDRADELKKQLMAQYASPQTRARTLEDIVVRDLLADEARKRELHETPAFRERLMQVADDLLAGQLLAEQLKSTLVITEEDVARYYEANKSRYKVPAQLALAHIECRDRESADDVLARLKEGGDFAALAKKFSVDSRSKDSGGVIEQPLIEGSTVIAGVGDRPEAAEALWKLPPDAVLPEPVEGEGTLHVLKVHQRREARQPALDEIRDRLRRDFTRQRTEEITRHYVKQLFEKYQVKLYPQAFTISTSWPANADS